MWPLSQAPPIAPHFNQLTIRPTDSEATQLALTTVLRRKGRILEAGVNSRQRLRQNLLQPIKNFWMT
jgi:hypothetical protein